MVDGTHTHLQLLLMGFSHYFLSQYEHETAITDALADGWTGTLEDANLLKYPERTRRQDVE